MKGVLWFVWVLCFLLLFVAASLVKEARVSSHTWVYVVETDLGMEALSKADYYNQRVEGDVSTESIAQTIYEPSIKRGPVEGAIEWYATESIFDFPSNHFVYHQLKTQEEIDEAYQALIDYANADSAMVQFRPGLPAQTRLSFRLFGFTVLRFLIFAGLSTIAALIVRMIWNLEVRTREKWDCANAAGILLLTRPRRSVRSAARSMGQVFDPMRKQAVIFVWIVLTLGFQFAFIYQVWRHPHNQQPLFRPGNGQGESVDVFISQNGDNFEISEQVVVNSDTPRPVGHYTYIIDEKYHPIDFFYEFFTERELTVVLNDVVAVPGYRDRLQLDSAQASNLSSALYGFAKDHPVLSRANPGGPAVLSLDLKRTKDSLLCFLLFACVSGVLVYGTNKDINDWKARRGERRRLAGCCVHCAYPVSGNEGPICPECGQKHGSEVEMAA